MAKQETELKESLGSALLANATAIRNRRISVEQQWLRAFRMWMNEDDERRYVSTETSPNNYYLPSARRTLERTCVRGAKMLTPNTRWHNVAAVGDTSDVQLSNADKFMTYILRKKIKSRSIINQLTRCMLIYGRCHLLTSIAVKRGQVWPSWRAVDPFSYYIFPETASVVTDADLMFEDYLCSYESFQAKVNRGIFEDIPRSELSKPDWPYHLVERLAYHGITDPTTGVKLTGIDAAKRQLNSLGESFLSMSSMWLQRESKFYQVYIVWNATPARIVAFYESSYDEPLYKSVVHRGLPGVSYTNSMADDIVDLHHLSNDQLNMYLDAVLKERGKWAVNDEMVSRADSIVDRANAIWHFREDPRLAMQHFAPQVTSTNQLRSLQIFWALINSLSGAGTIAEGQPGRNMPRAGFAVNSLINLGMADIQDVVDLIEQEVLTLGLEDIYHVSAEFIPDSQLMKIPGGKSLTGFKSILRRNDIIGDYDFEWIGANQFQDENLRAQRLMIFLNLALQPMAMQMLAQQKYTLNLPELFQTVWRYGLGERAMDKIIVPISDLEQQLTLKLFENKQDKGGSTGNSSLNYSLPNVTNGFVQQ